MADRTTNFLVTLVFDENLHIGRQIDTELSFKSEIIKDLQHLIKGREIKHFIVADDEVINDKLKEEPKTGHWYRKHCWEICFTCSECGITNASGTKYKYCPNCGTRMVEPQESEEK